MIRWTPLPLRCRRGFPCRLADLPDLAPAPLRRPLHPADLAAFPGAEKQLARAAWLERDSAKLRQAMWEAPAACSSMPAGEKLSLVVRWLVLLFVLP